MLDGRRRRLEAPIRRDRKRGHAAAVVGHDGGRRVLRHRHEHRAGRAGRLIVQLREGAVAIDAEGGQPASGLVRRAASLADRVQGSAFRVNGQEARVLHLRCHFRRRQLAGGGVEAKPVDSLAGRVARVGADIHERFTGRRPLRERSLHAAGRQRTDGREEHEDDPGDRMSRKTPRSQFSTPKT